MEKKELKNLFVQMNAETSYQDKLYSEAEENIKIWKMKIRQLKIDRHDYAMMNYILDSRFSNIQVLKTYHGKRNIKETPQFQF